ncbi:hypothetical protein PPACK8108_LOCUS14594 [Phakopsora pachyrhizi]|uniref:Uncharacterized protein n=1 Tax=Phakopsora pachyrhizi TaxID=170000 RepID=A0AAV0B7L1_PHAPC|nr:hypothetical protein PPACK8108_LOCUS14594 [Phakopsora pachyrhizi]
MPSRVAVRADYGQSIKDGRVMISYWDKEVRRKTGSLSTSKGDLQDNWSWVETEEYQPEERRPGTGVPQFQAGYPGVMRSRERRASRGEMAMYKEKREIGRECLLAASGQDWGLARRPGFRHGMVENLEKGGLGGLTGNTALRTAIARRITKEDGGGLWEKSKREREKARAFYKKEQLTRVLTDIGNTQNRKEGQKETGGGVVGPKLTTSYKEKQTGRDG